MEGKNEEGNDKYLNMVETCEQFEQKIEQVEEDPKMIASEKEKAETGEDEMELQTPAASESVLINHNDSVKKVAKSCIMATGKAIRELEAATLHMEDKLEDNVKRKEF